MTCRASRWPSVSTAMCSLEPFLRLAPSYPARSPLSRCGAERAAVQDGGTGLGVSTCGQAEDHAQVVGQGLEHTSGQPTLRLLVDCRPGRQVIGHGPPRNAVPDDVAQAIEQLAERIPALTGILTQQDQVWRDERPFFIGDVRGVRLPGRLYALY